MARSVSYHKQFYARWRKSLYETGLLIPLRQAIYDPQLRKPPLGN